MITRPVAIRLESIPGPTREAIALAAQWGFDAVEFDVVGELSAAQLSQTGRREIRHVLKTHGLRLAAVGFPTRRGYDHLERLEARVEATKTALGLARELGTFVVINQVGQIPEGEETPRSQAFCDVMRSIASEGERTGARLAIQTGIDPPDRLAKFLTDLGAYGLAINLAPAGLLMHGVDLCASVEQLATWIVGVHARDVVRSGITASGIREVKLGEGEVGWDRLLPTLAAIDYTGHVTIARNAPIRDVSDIAEAIEFIRRTNEAFRK